MDLSQFESFPAHVELSAEPERITIDYDCVVRVNAGRLDLNIQKSGEEFYCQGNALASVRLTCARCLEEFDFELTNNTDFIVCSQEWHRSHGGIRDNEDYVFFSGGELQADLTDILRQAIIISLSLKPLCKEDCRGLCPSCGTNRNEESCQCQVRQTDDRWEALRKLSGLT